MRADELGEGRRRRSCRRGRRGRSRRAPLPAPPSPCAPATAFIEWQLMCQLRAEARVRRLDARRAAARVVGPVVALDPALRPRRPPSLRVVDRRAVVERAPDQRLAEPRLAARHVLARPAAAFDQLEVDVAGVPVVVDVGARHARRDQADAALGRRQVELVDEAVLAFAQLELAHARAEIGREVDARMGRIEDQRTARRGRAVDDEGRGEERGGHLHSIVLAAAMPGESSR